MLGKTDKPSLNSKAAEAKGMVEFVVYMLEVCMPKFADVEQRDKAEMLLACGQAAVNVDVILSRSGAAMPDAEIEAFFGAVYQHTSLFKRAGGALSPSTTPCSILF
jgi:hypothetical protein